jgi:hypothetical protein
MKKLMIILCAFSLVAVLGCATSKSDCPVYVTNPNCKLVSFKAGSEPEGYNGIKWETKLSGLERMKHSRTDPTHGGIEFYVREGDTFKLENGKNKPVQYGFWRENSMLPSSLQKDRKNLMFLKTLYLRNLEKVQNHS